MKVSIGLSKGWLRLRWQHEGKAYSLNVGLQDFPTNWAYAQQVAGRIQFDILGHQFDPTLLKYRPKTLGKTATEVSCAELFERFTRHRFKDYGLSPGSRSRYNCIQNYLSARLDMPAHQVSDRTAGNFAAYLSERLSGITAKTYIYLIAAVWDWAKGRYHVGEPNPWPDLAAKTKTQQQQRVKPFTAAEIQAIIGAFRSCPHFFISQQLELLIHSHQPGKLTPGRLFSLVPKQYEALLLREHPTLAHSRQR